MKETLARTFEGLQKELVAYLCRLVVRPSVAEELAQTAVLRGLESADSLPREAGGQRAWLFKVATRLAIDELRRHANWRETAIFELREQAEGDALFMARSAELVGTPETKAIAREHLLACLACTLRQLPERKAAALLLKEVHGFSLEETAQCLEATSVQVKNWLQEARRHMEGFYGPTCALVAKAGVCHQCSELDSFFAAETGNPLAARGSAHVAERLEIARQLRDRPWGSWHRLLMELVDDLG
ncbi:MAG TPA: RNA polymerase sigma factor [Rhodocyclaceae bacterium]|nr:RNA polymerase sigma factor [Rhodocyclaceae bacterium]